MIYNGSYYYFEKNLFGDVLRVYNSSGTTVASFTDLLRRARKSFRRVPLSDFFATVPGEFRQIISLPVCVNPGSACNCYWDMPFHKECRMTLENLNLDMVIFFYQADYVEEEHDDEIYIFMRSSVA